MENSEVKQHIDDANIIKQDPITLAAPKPIWLEFLWVFSTFSFYSCFWLVKRINEIKKWNQSNLTPWLWFFVPLFAIFQIFAFPKMVGEIQTIQKKLNLPLWTAWSFSWHLIIFGTTVFFNISDTYEFPSWTLIVGLLVISTLYSVLANQIKTIKLASTDICLKEPTKALRIIEITIVSILSIIMLIFLLFIAYEGFKGRALENFNTGDTYKNSEDNFQVPIIGKGWIRVNTGTVSDGSSITEFKGPLENMYFVVFSYNKNDETISSISTSRLYNIKDSTPSPQCTQIRHLDKKQTGVVVKIVCKSNLLGSPTVETATIFETEDKIIETYGYLSSMRNTFKKYENDFINMASGFQHYEK